MKLIYSNEGLPSFITIGSVGLYIFPFWKYPLGEIRKPQ